MLFHVFFISSQCFAFCFQAKWTFLRCCYIDVSSLRLARSFGWLLGDKEQFSTLLLAVLLCDGRHTHCYLLFVSTLFGSHAILIFFSLSSCPSFLFNQSCWLVSHTLFKYKALKVNIFVELNSWNVHWQSIHSIQINAHQRRVAIAIKYFNSVWFVFFSSLFSLYWSYTYKCTHNLEIERKMFFYILYKYLLYVNFFDVYQFERTLLMWFLLHSTVIFLHNF